MFWCFVWFFWGIGDVMVGVIVVIVRGDYLLVDVGSRVLGVIVLVLLVVVGNWLWGVGR